jgi:hypothetical protein
MNTNEKEIELQNVENESTEQEEMKPVCKNGVCELNWQPKRPQAA